MRAGCDAVFLDLHGAMVLDDCDDAEGEIVQRAAPHRAADADRRHARLPHQSVADAGRPRDGDRRLQDLPARRHVRDRAPRRRNPGARARRRDRTGDGLGPAAAAGVDHAPRARGWAFRATSSILRGAWRPMARCSPPRCCRRFRMRTRRIRRCRRSSSPMRGAAGARRRGASATRMLDIAWATSRRVRAPRAAAGRVGRARRRRWDSPIPARRCC